MPGSVRGARCWVGVARAGAGYSGRVSRGGGVWGGRCPGCPPLPRPGAARRRRPSTRGRRWDGASGGDALAIGRSRPGATRAFVSGRRARPPGPVSLPTSSFPSFGCVRDGLRREPKADPFMRCCERLYSTGPSVSFSLRERAGVRGIRATAVLDAPSPCPSPVGRGDAVGGFAFYETAFERRMRAVRASALVGDAEGDPGSAAPLCGAVRNGGKGCAGGTWRCCLGRPSGKGAGSGETAVHAHRGGTLGSVWHLTHGLRTVPRPFACAALHRRSRARSGPGRTGCPGKPGHRKLSFALLAAIRLARSRLPAPSPNSL